MRNLLLISLLVGACQSDRQPTRRDVFEPVAQSWCERNYSCDVITSPREIDECTEHNVYHFCGLYKSCEDWVAFDLLDASVACQEDLAAHPCPLVYYGVLPESCEFLLEELGDE